MEAIAARITGHRGKARDPRLFKRLAGEGIAAEPARAQRMKGRAARRREIDGATHRHLSPA